MSELPIAPVGRIIKNAGAERVSADGSEALAALMEEYGTQMAREAIKLTRHAGRKTVKAVDIKMASEILR
ncbi:histone family protein [Methanofollis aquaemaris]|jgi:histone H3/H4|uniref:Histone family protein n=1 Tax=Methanofollis aquaemaris TaxID=126734 RepID=A0A8A3S3Y5_9EURY|nr:histone family protein [Methanofollis aquaemaris]QSZ66589.1 histone family protein [Methanofollis aquaemaris]